MTRKRHRRPLRERFDSGYVPEPNSGCWLWLGYLLPAGYGKIGCLVDGRWRTLYAHRVGYELHRGHIPKGLDLDHLCRTPCCVNPWHLEPVTARENVRRSKAPAALNAGKTHCKRGHEFTPENTLVLHTLYGPARRCRTCHRANVYRSKHRAQ